MSSDIGKLVDKGLKGKIQQALDVVRVVGNHSVHPGQINFEDNEEIAETLFDLVNMIAQDMITEEREMAEMFNKLPKSDRKKIAKRDNPSSQ